MSGRKNVLLPIPLLEAGDMSGDLVAGPIQVKFLDNAGIQLTWTGTPTGTFAVQASVDGVVYYDLTFDPVLDQPAGAAGGYLINLNQLPFAYFQVTYTAGSGTGALDVWACVKEV